MKFSEWLELQDNEYKEILNKLPHLLLKNLDMYPDFQFRDDGRLITRAWKEYKEYLTTNPPIH